MMVIWLNGSFGIGKSTTADMLKNKFENSYIYDPELIGYFLRDNLGYINNDFQYYKLWRELNSEIILDLTNRFSTIIIPMTITNKAYYDEIISKLLDKKIEINHFILNASKETIINRLDSRKDSTEWSYLQVDRCISAFENEIFGEMIDTDDRTKEEIVELIFNLIQGVKHDNRKFKI